MDAKFKEYVHLHENKSLLRFITCGSVDDGKSTLIGRLLHDSQNVLDDQLATLAQESVKHGTQGEAMDFALLLDGLAAEREQGITIDVAYRYFSTEIRKFIVADCPGHEQYTRNMVTGASTADVAVVLIDARKGVVTQTRRHSFIVSQLGIKHIVLAVNKMDLVEYQADCFETIVRKYIELAEQLGIHNIHAIPVCALTGENLVASSNNMPWYAGQTVLKTLEQVQVEMPEHTSPARFPVQMVSRPNLDFRGFAGTLCAGTLSVGDAVMVLPSGAKSRVARIIGAHGDVTFAHNQQAITLTLQDEIDVSRGDVLVAANAPCEVADQFSVQLIWMENNELIPGRGYFLKMATRTVNASITEVKHKVDINSQELLAAKTLQLNDIGVCTIRLDQSIAFEAFASNKTLGGFILIDRQSNATVAAGTIDFALRRANNIHWQALEVDKQSRALLKAQKPRCVWFTGLSGSGKSAIANLLEKKLLASNHHTYILDGDNVRHGLNKDLGFTEIDRVENIRRVAEVAKLMVDAGLVVLVSFISPFQSDREMARALFNDDEFVEVFVDTPLEICEQRDVKGLYAKARAGNLPNFTGITSPYELPVKPEIHLQTQYQNLEALAQQLIAYLEKS